MYTSRHILVGSRKPFLKFSYFWPTPGYTTDQSTEREYWPYTVKDQSPADSNLLKSQIPYTVEGEGGKKCTSNFRCWVQIC